MENYDNIWEIVFKERSKQPEMKTPEMKAKEMKAKEMGSEKKSLICEHLERNEIACTDCGLVLENQPEFDNFMYEQPIENRTRSMPFNRLTQLQDWISWTKEEKTEYKLKKYVREFCQKLSIYPNIIDTIAHLVNRVLETIKEKNDGSKRSRIKDAIIINCICYTCKDYDPSYLAKRANIESKYLSKADRILLDLNLNCPQTNNHQTNNQLQLQLRNAFLKKCNNNESDLEKKLVILMEIVDDNKLLNVSETSTVCFYYLLMQKTLVDLASFSEHFKINPSHLTKSFNKLAKVQEKINQILN
jgi:hypothetical protein